MATARFRVLWHRTECQIMIAIMLQNCRLLLHKGSSEQNYKNCIHASTNNLHISSLITGLEMFKQPLYRVYRVLS